MVGRPSGLKELVYVGCCPPAFAERPIRYGGSAAPNA